MLVRVEMRQPDAGLEQRFDLRRQLPLDLRERHPAPQAGSDERLPRGWKPLIASNEGGYTGRRERWRAVDQCQVRTESERRVRTRASDGVCGGGRVGEQARARQD